MVEGLSILSPLLNQVRESGAGAQQAQQIERAIRVRSIVLSPGHCARASRRDEWPEGSSLLCRVGKTGSGDCVRVASLRTDTSAIGGTRLTHTDAASRRCGAASGAGPRPRG